MPEITTNITNINPHYSSNTKATIPPKMVVAGPNALPGQHLYNDTDANNRMRQINNEITYNSKEVRKNPAKQFWKVFAGIVVTVLGIIGIKKLITFFK